MANVRKFSPARKAQRRNLAVGSSRSVADTIKFLLENLPHDDREAVLAEITDFVRPIPVERAGDVLGVIVKFAQRNQSISVQDVKAAVKQAGIEAKPKEVYNAIGYLTRKGHIHRTGYGRYIVDGVEIVTSEDLGGATSRHEDAYRVDESDQSLADKGEK
ncbi:hypothetical protein [Rhizobium sp. BK491]|uniref:hypothetical protein n=1 Tax=Rhizobium sp. BK491 TaxID=2587009 RepID=UPI00161F1A52|nr:hypothetical protein [Rhizobium sp. BK491]MBB3570785.1 hypothetical protein [Rhizobium sp. BK491]